MSLIADLVLQTANAPGTATFNLIPPVAGRVSFVGGNGAGQAYYVATDGTNWEKGYGTVTAGSPDTLSRDTVIRNSLGTTAKINFSSTVTILSDIPAERAIYASADNGSVPLAARVVTGAGAAFAADHLPRFDQVSDVRINIYSVSGGNIVIPTGGLTDPYRLDFYGLQPAAFAALYLRYSLDGGSTYQSGVSEYNYENVQAAGAALGSITGSISYLPLIQTLSSGAAGFGMIEIMPSYHQWRGHVIGNTGTNRTQEMPSGNWNTAGTPTHWLISAVGSSLSGGAARLTRMQF